MKALSLLILALFSLGLFVISYTGCGILHSKPHVKVTVFNSTAHYDNSLKDNWAIIEKAGKLDTHYAYKQVAYGCINAGDYKKKHSSDLIVASPIPGEGHYLIIVLSDNPIPDGEFFLE